ncbi:hypothetical protein F5887DRAFT_1081511 [Amanita rubescens]|nr:hypothetical protein F5887DRAFT_1081511 [Amanita rubescens]
MSSLNNTDIITTSTQGLLTGVYFASFLLCIRWLAFSDDGGGVRKGINWPLLTATIVLFGFAVTDLGLSLQETLLASEGLSNQLYPIMSKFIELFLPTITEGFLIFRCWGIYNRSWRITVFPLLLLVFNISSSPVITFYISRTSTVRILNVLYGLQGAYSASTSILNIYVTTVIICKIRKSLSRPISSFTISIIAESGLLFTLTSVGVLSVVFLNVPGAYPIANAINFPVSGVAYNLVLIREAQNRVKQEEDRVSSLAFGNSTVQRTVPTVQRHHSESAFSS